MAGPAKINYFTSEDAAQACLPQIGEVLNACLNHAEELIARAVSQLRAAGFKSDGGISGGRIPIVTTAMNSHSRNPFGRRIALGAAIQAHDTGRRIALRQRACPSVPVRPQRNCGKQGKSIPQFEIHPPNSPLDERKFPSAVMRTLLEQEWCLRKAHRRIFTRRRQLALAALLLPALMAFDNSALAHRSVMRGASGPPAQQAAYDLVIRNARVMDPETRLDQPGTNIGIRAGRIAVVTRDDIHGREEIDVAGRVAAPGFIDLVSYDPNPAGVWNKIADGVTTNLALHGGTTDPRAWYAYYAGHPPPVNYGASFFYSQARNELKIPLTAPATDQQIAELSARCERALRAGALAVSFSLEYVPGIRREEIIPLMRLARRYQAPVFFHARYSTMEGPGTNLDALKEIIEDARETGAAVEIEHLSSTGGTFSMGQSLAMLEAARGSGLDISADSYPYTYWATYLDSERFAPGWQQRFRISFHDLQIAGSTERLNAESFARYRHEHRIAAAYAIPEADVEAALRWPWMMIASDGILDASHNNHPRASGTFTRTLAVYVREKKLLTLMDALARMSLMPARRMQQSDPAFQQKGRLAPGADADLVVFDPERVQDRATVEHPEVPAEGMDWVLVGGVLVKSPQGLRRGAHPGRPLRGAASARGGSGSAP